MTARPNARPQTFERAELPITEHQTAPLLSVRGLTVHFQEFVALRDVSLSLDHGGIHAVIGPNGAGKSTLFNAISGFVKPTRGQISLHGLDVTAWPANRLARLGLARSFQICAVFPELSVEENLLVAQLRDGKAIGLVRQRRGRELNPLAADLLDKAGLMAERRRRAGELPYGRRRLLEIITTLALQPRLLLLDEPTAGLGREDIPAVVELIAHAAETCGVLLVEHNLKVVERLADHVTVLAGGTVLSEGTYQHVSQDQNVWKAYLGAAPDA
jgi:branched-chain amino acid transport system ATP-binding protein